MTDDAGRAELEKHFTGPSNFKVMDIGIPEPRYPSWRWFITNVGWNRPDHEKTLGRGILTVDLEEAIPSESNELSRRIKITVTAPLSFRVQDESEMSPYWHVRHTEKVEVADFYEIGASQYLYELKFMTLISYEPVRHFLILGGNQCVEFIGDDVTEFEVAHISCDT